MKMARQTFATGNKRGNHFKTNIRGRGNAGIGNRGGWTGNRGGRGGLIQKPPAPLMSRPMLGPPSMRRPLLPPSGGMRPPLFDRPPSGRMGPPGPMGPLIPPSRMGPPGSLNRGPPGPRPFEINHRPNSMHGKNNPRGKLGMPPNRGKPPGPLLGPGPGGFMGPRGHPAMRGMLPPPGPMRPPFGRGNMMRPPMRGGMMNARGPGSIRGRLSNFRGKNNKSTIPTKNNVKKVLNEICLKLGITPYCRVPKN